MLTRQSKDSLGWATVLLLLIVLLLSTRIPLIPRQIYSFDDVNLAYALDDFDPLSSQPQLPGYPLFVLQMKVLRLLRVVNPESILFLLTFIGSIAAVVATAFAGRIMFGPQAGLIAAALLILYPSFWFASLTSGLRTQLALVSAGVAYACWRSWNGERKWALLSSVFLGVGAGIRPELGVLLFPLWAIGVYRAGNTRDRLLCVLLLAVTGFAWFVPTIYASQGPQAYFKASVAYLTTQDTLKVETFGLEWRRTAVWLVTWTLPVLLFWPMMRVLTNRPLFQDLRGLLFFFVWVFPAGVFGVFVHVADAGHSLALLVPICILAAGLLHRMAESTDCWSLTMFDFMMPIILGAPFLVLYFFARTPPMVMVLGVPLLSLLAALPIRFRVRSGGPPVRYWTAVSLVLWPCLMVFIHTFLAAGWQVLRVNGPSLLEVWVGVNSGFAMSSFPPIKETTDRDDHVIRTIRNVSAQSGTKVVVICYKALTEWRKLTYYLPNIDVIALEDLGENSLATTWRRNRKVGTIKGQDTVDLQLPAGTSIVWVTNPMNPLTQQLRGYPGATVEETVTVYPSLPQGTQLTMGRFRIRL